jgi:hypothetical protein
MPLLGNAAMLLSFDVVDDAIAEHDDWHTHEHLPERLSLPGFRRGTRWVAMRGSPRYFVMYEVDELAALQSEAYLERLNRPSAWTSRVMPHYRGMSRRLCTVSRSHGAGLGAFGVIVGFVPDAGTETSLRAWLVDDILPGLPSRRGLGSAHLFEAALTPPMTHEQRLRGVDAVTGWGLFVTGYDDEALAGLMESDLHRRHFVERGATSVSDTLHRLHYALTDREASARPTDPPPCP